MHATTMAGVPSHAHLQRHAYTACGAVDGMHGLRKDAQRDLDTAFAERETAAQASEVGTAQAQQADGHRDHKQRANITTEVGRSLKELKKANNAHYTDHVEAMQREFAKTKEFDVFEDILECDITNREFIVNSILLFAEKYGKRNEFVKARTRLAAQGFRQQKNTNYFETYAATPQDDTWRYMLSLCASNNWEVLRQIDWTSAFFYPLLQEAVALRMPTECRQWKWCAVHSGFCEVYKKCKRAIHGLNQSSRAFSDLVAADFEEQGH